MYQSCCCLLLRSPLQSTGSNTFFGKTATMLQSAGGIGHLQKILMSIVIALVAISLILCITMLGYLLGYGREPFKEALTFVVVVLVVSIPIAIEIVCTTTLALGSRELSGHGAIVTRLASIEEMAGMNMVSSSSNTAFHALLTLISSHVEPLCMLSVVMHSGDLPGMHMVSSTNSLIELLRDGLGAQAMPDRSGDAQQHLRTLSCTMLAARPSCVCIHSADSAAAFLLPCVPLCSFSYLSTALL
jgi:hypothetical protein